MVTILADFCREETVCNPRSADSNAKVFQRWEVPQEGVFDERLSSLNFR
jgi:hypothetical protein